MLHVNARSLAHVYMLLHTQASELSNLKRQNQQLVQELTAVIVKREEEDANTAALVESSLALSRNYQLQQVCRRPCICHMCSVIRAELGRAEGWGAANPSRHRLARAGMASSGTVRSDPVRAKLLVSFHRVSADQ